MNFQPPWERALRRKLRHKAKRFPSKDSLNVNAMIALTFFGACIIAVISLTSKNDTERMVAVTLVTGAFGTLIGSMLRARWQDGAWIALYAPVDTRTMRILETRGALTNLIRYGLMGLLMAILGCFAGWPLTAATALPVAMSAMVTGMVFSSGRWGKIMLWASGIGATFWSLTEIIHKDLAPGSMAHGYLHGWLPAFPLSLWSGDGSILLLRLPVFAAAIAVVFFEWRKAWRGMDIDTMWNPPSLDQQSHLTDDRESPDQELKTEDPRPTLRDDLRASVTRGWIGLAAYVDWDQIKWFDRLLWKSLDPRQRMLVCLGIFETRLWLRGLKITSVLLAATVALVWIMRLSMQQVLGPAMANYGALLGLPASGLVIISCVCSSPGRHSTLKPWTQPFRPGFQRSIAPLAIFPISPREWARCAAREWQIRACFVALMWSISTVAVALAFSTQASLRELFGWFIAPWLLLLAMLPFSVGGRLLQAHYGSTQGINVGMRLSLSYVIMAISPAAVIVAIIGFELQHFPTFAGSMVLAAVTGWAGLRLAVANCRNMKADIAFENKS